MINPKINVVTVDSYKEFNVPEHNVCKDYCEHFCKLF